MSSIWLCCIGHEKEEGRKCRDGWEVWLKGDERGAGRLYSGIDLIRIKASSLLLANAEGKMDVDSSRRLVCNVASMADSCLVDKTPHVLLDGN